MAALAARPVAVLAIALAAAAGYLASGIRTGGEGGEAMSAGDVRLALPEGWRIEPEARSVGGLELEHAVAARAPDERGLAVAGTLPGVVFPQGLGRSVDGTAPEPAAVRLGRLEAYRWRGTGTLFAAPTGRGTAVLACSGPPAAVRQCERTGATLEVPGAAPTALDALGFYGANLDGTLSHLERRRRAAFARLRAAAVRTKQAAVATRLRRVHDTAARALGDLAPPPSAGRANEALMEALREMGGAYGELARAARKGRRGAYAAAARGVDRSERALQAILGRMAPPA